jgi:hypothetical protein
METTPESATSNVKSTETNTSNDTDSEKTNTSATTLPKDPKFKKIRQHFIINFEHF